LRRHQATFVALGVATLAALGWSAYAELNRRAPWARYRDEAMAIAQRNGVSPAKPTNTAFGEDCGACHANSSRCGLTVPFEIGAALDAGLSNETAQRQFCITKEQVQAIREIREGLCGDPPAANGAKAQDCLSQEELREVARAAGVYCDAPSRARWTSATAACLGKADRATLDAALRKATFNVPAWAQTHPFREQLLDKHLAVAGIGCQDCHGGDLLALAAVHPTGTTGKVHSQDPNAPGALLESVEFGRHTGANGAATVRRRLPELREANCARCHPETTELAFAPALSRGRKLFRELGCTGCHPLAAFEASRIPGPQLRGIGQKLSAERIVEWTKSPRTLLPRTRMPTVFVPALGENPKPEALRERDEDTAAIAAYLLDDAGDRALGTVGQGDAKAGEQLFSESGCGGCHAREVGATNRPTEGSPHRDFAPNLAKAGDRLNREWLVSWLENPQGWWREARMPQMSLSPRQAADLADYLMTVLRAN
jgi:cytochrome c551/c552